MGMQWYADGVEVRAVAGVTGSTLAKALAPNLKLDAILTIGETVAVVPLGLVLAENAAVNIRAHKGHHDGTEKVRIAASDVQMIHDLCVQAGRGRVYLFTTRTELEASIHSSGENVTTPLWAGVNPDMRVTEAIADEAGRGEAATDAWAGGCPGVPESAERDRWQRDHDELHSDPTSGAECAPNCPGYVAPETVKATVTVKPWVTAHMPTTTEEADAAEDAQWAAWVTHHRLGTDRRSIDVAMRDAIARDYADAQEEIARWQRQKWSDRHGLIWNTALGFGHLAPETLARAIGADYTSAVADYVARGGNPDNVMSKCPVCELVNVGPGHTTPLGHPCRFGETAEEREARHADSRAYQRELASKVRRKAAPESAPEDDPDARRLLVAVAGGEEKYNALMAYGAAGVLETTEHGPIDKAAILAKPIDSLMNSGVNEPETPESTPDSLAQLRIGDRVRVADVNSVDRADVGLTGTVAEISGYRHWLRLDKGGPELSGPWKVSELESQRAPEPTPTIVDIHVIHHATYSTVWTLYNNEKRQHDSDILLADGTYAQDWRDLCGTRAEAEQRARETATSNDRLPTMFRTSVTVHDFTNVKALNGWDASQSTAGPVPFVDSPRAARTDPVPFVMVVRGTIDPADRAEDDRYTDSEVVEYSRQDVRDELLLQLTASRWNGLITGLTVNGYTMDSDGNVHDANKGE